MEEFSVRKKVGSSLGHRFFISPYSYTRDPMPMFTHKSTDVIKFAPLFGLRLICEHETVIVGKANLRRCGNSGDRIDLIGNVNRAKCYVH